LIMGASILFQNSTFDGYNAAVIQNIYANLYQDDSTSSSGNNDLPDSENSTFDLEKAKIEFPEDTYMKRYDDFTVVFLLPGERNISVANYIVTQSKPYFYNYSTYLNQISLTIYFFNPISEIYLQAIFTYKRTIQGTLSFEHMVRGAFPMLYMSHQFDKALLNFYFIVKLLFFIWTICLFLYKFFTVRKKNFVFFI